MNIENVLVNMGESQLTKSFLSDTVLKTLKQYDKSLLIPSKLRQFIIEQTPKAEVLQNTKMRCALINSLDENNLILLSKMLGIQNNVNLRTQLSNMKVKKIL